MPRRLLAPFVLLTLAGCGSSGERPRSGGVPPGAERHPAPVAAGQTVRANLDGDPAPEELVIERTGPQVRLALRDRCGPATVSFPLTPPADGIVRRDVFRARGAGAPPAIAVESRAGAAGAAGFAAVLAYSECSAPVRLFSYSSSDPRPRPGGGRRVVDFTFAVDGPRLRLSEALAGPAEAQCCPSQHRVSEYRLGRGAQRYELVGSRVDR
ncbi:MAG: hypothetical protein ACR2K9_03670 [Solirubrobacteraceae bacterium]